MDLTTPPAVALTFASSPADLGGTAMPGAAGQLEAGPPPELAALVLAPPRPALGLVRPPRYLPAVTLEQLEQLHRAEQLAAVAAGGGLVTVTPRGVLHVRDGAAVAAEHRRPVLTAAALALAGAGALAAAWPRRVDLGHGNRGPAPRRRRR